VREWLNAQAARGYVGYHAVSGTYELSPEQTVVLADEDSPVHIPRAWNVPASMWFDEEQTLDAFRTGRGVPLGDHAARLSCGVAAFYRNGLPSFFQREAHLHRHLPVRHRVVLNVAANLLYFEPA
jgi:hypothetical protein